MNNLMIRQNYIPKRRNGKDQQLYFKGTCKSTENSIQGKTSYINRNNYYTKNYSRYTHYFVVDYKDIYGRLLCRKVYRRNPMVIYNGKRYLGSTIGNNKFNCNCRYR